MADLRTCLRVVQYAEEQAQLLHRMLFGREAQGERLVQWREAQLDLIGDLRRVESRNVVAQLIATTCGLEVDTTAPRVSRRGGHRQIEISTRSGSVFFGEDLAEWIHQFPMPLPDEALEDLGVALRVIAERVLT